MTTITIDGRELDDVRVEGWTNGARCITLRFLTVSERDALLAWAGKPELINRTLNVTRRAPDEDDTEDFSALLSVVDVVRARTTNDTAVVIAESEAVWQTNSAQKMHDFLDDGAIAPHATHSVRCVTINLADDDETIDRFDSDFDCTPAVRYFGRE